MCKFSRFFAPLLCAGLFAAYAPITQAETYDNTATVALMQTKQSQCRSYGGKVGNKALNAFANLTAGVLEIPKNIINTTNQSNIVYGVVGGLFKGLIHTGGRIGVGIADLVTIPLPTKPIAQPIYIWEDFDVDTAYGPVFRLDTCQEEPSAAQAPIPEPVLAPVVIAPKPEPIDNAKQYRQEINQKLDVMFKKEMMK